MRWRTDPEVSCPEGCSRKPKPTTVRPHALPDGRVSATFDLIFLTGWAPSVDQQRALRPGSAKTRLADALSTEETKL